MTEAAPPQPEEEATVQPRTRIWMAFDIGVEGPDAVTLIEAVIEEGQDCAQGHLIGWRVINPANEADKAEFAAIGEDLTRTFEDEGPMEPLPFDSSEVRGKIGEHLIKKHAYITDYVEATSQSTLVEEHIRIHGDPTEEYLEHSHESLRPEDL